MERRHLTATAVGICLLLGACGEGSPAPKASTATTAVSAVPVTTVASAATAAGSPAPNVTVRTDDLDAQLSSVDRELHGAQDSVNQANDTSPDRADD
jgi:hypothetical protein